MSGIYEKIAASPEDVEQYAGEIPPEYLYCRVWHHDPAPHNVVLAKDETKHPTAVWEARLRCSHGCGIQWKVLVDAAGEVLQRKYDDSGAPDYVLKGKGRIDKHGKQILRREFFMQTGPKPRKKRAKR